MIAAPTELMSKGRPGSQGGTHGGNAVSAAVVQQATTRYGLLSLTCSPAGNVVRLIPALVVTPDEIDLGLSRFADTLADVLER